MADPTTLLKRAAALYKKGERAKARDILLKLIEVDEDNEKAWLLLSAAVDGLEDKQIALENVLTINPKNEKARKGLDLINKKLAQQPVKAKDEPLGGSGWSQIDTESEVEQAEDGWGAYLNDDTNNESPFDQSSAPAPAKSATTSLDSDSVSSWGDIEDSGWGDLDASAVFSQATTPAPETPAPVEETPASDWGTTPPVADTPVESSWGDLDTSADPWGGEPAIVDDAPAWGEMSNSPPVVAEETPWGDTAASTPSLTEETPWGDTATSASTSLADDDSPWADTALPADDASPWDEMPAAVEESPWGETSSPAPASPATSSSQPTSGEYDDWIDELNLKSTDSSAAEASPWGATPAPAEESSPWAQDAAAVSDAWSDWGTGETPIVEASQPADDNPWASGADSGSASSSGSPFSAGLEEDPFGEMPIEDMASSTSLDMDDNPFDSAIDVNAPSPFSSPVAEESQASSGLNFGTNDSAFSGFLDEEDDEALDLFDDEAEDNLTPFSASISDSAGRNKRLAMASSGGDMPEEDRFLRMIPSEIQLPPKRGSQLGVLLSVFVLGLLNFGAIGLLVSQLLG